MKNRQNLTRSALLGLMASIATVAPLTAGCLGDEMFPDRVPVRPHHQRWVDRPLERTLVEEQSKTREVVAQYLEQQRTRDCLPDAAEARRRAVTQAQARTEHARTRASVQAEQRALLRQAAGAEEIDLSPIISFAQARADSGSGDTTLFRWNCDAPPEDACFETSAHVGLNVLYASTFKDADLSRVAIARMLPVLREDIRWMLSEIDASATPRVAAGRIQTLCRQGQSPLAEYIKERSRSNDDRDRTLARRLGGEQACKHIAPRYQLLLKTLSGYLDNTKNADSCVPTPQLEWNL